MKAIFPGDNAKQDILINVLIIFAVILILFPMKEVSMGGKIKWVALHVALTQAALTLLAVNSVVAFLSFFKFQKKLTRYVQANMVFSVVLWGITYATMLWVTRITWGGFDWEEPRMLASTQLLFILLPYLALNLLINFDWLMRYTTVAMGIFAQFLIRFAPVVNHPADPVGKAENIVLSMQFGGLVLLLIFLVMYDSMLLTTKNKN